MPFELDDTIAAISTSKGGAGIGIIRLSGKKSLKIARIITKKNIKKNRVNYSNFYNLNNDIIDFGIVIFFMSPKSFTGEDVIEFHGHGSDLILDNLLSCILNLGARIAKPGEFTFRAYLNNKIDLLQAESINDLINSKNFLCNKFILKSLFGELSSEIRKIFNKILDLRTQLEAGLEFPNDIFVDRTIFYNKLFELNSDFELLFNKLCEKNSFLDSIKIVIIGNTNVGKSSLFNLLLKKDRSIISNIPGTTRDFIESSFELSGFNFKLVDTAGFNDLSKCFIEKAGIAKTLEQIKDSLIILYMVDISKNEDPLNDKFFLNLINHYEEKIKIFLIKNKIDLLSMEEKIIFKKEYIEVLLSIKENRGIDLILNELKKILFEFAEKTYVVNKRNFSLFLKIKNDLSFIKKLKNSDIILDIYAENLKNCYNYFSEILGEKVSDDLLDQIFSKFCLGK